jgi:hypothetical protein
MPGFKLRERRLPSRRYPLRSIFSLDSLRQLHDTNLRSPILYRGVGFDIVWQRAAVAAVGFAP